MGNIIKRILIGILAGVFLSGCVLAPKGTDEENAAAQKAGAPYVDPFEKRVIPELPADPT